MVNETATATVVLTFDNLGEASELERGTRDERLALGRHPSVTAALPRLLDELTRLDLRATFFIEAINCELNPAPVRAIAERGHEIGVHGWRHELWADLSPEHERELLERALRAFESLGIKTAAFRPPGGRLTAATPELLAELDFRWCSPAVGEVPQDDHGLQWVPFEWELVDAYHLMDSFAPLRVQRGERAKPLPAASLAPLLAVTLRSEADSNRPRVVILHPFLMLDDAWWEGTRETLELIRELTR